MVQEYYHRAVDNTSRGLERLLYYHLQAEHQQKNYINHKINSSPTSRQILFSFNNTTKIKKYMVSARHQEISYIYYRQSAQVVDSSQTNTKKSTEKSMVEKTKQSELSILYHRSKDSSNR